MENSLEETARDIALKYNHKENPNGKQFGFWICCKTRISSSKETKCSECGDVCFYDDKLTSNTNKNAKKICTKCSYLNHFDELSPSTRELIKEVVFA